MRADDICYYCGAPAEGCLLDTRRSVCAACDDDSLMGIAERLMRMGEQFARDRARRYDELLPRHP